MKNEPFMVLGLGNPGARYKNTFHNAGFLFINFLTGKFLAFKKPSKNKNFEYAAANNLIFVKPLTFMNESGAAAKSAMNHFKIKPAKILAVHDDSDIELGKYKFSFGRGSAGHKGAESVIKSLGTKNFWRLRIGVSRKSKKTKASDFVLRKISKEDLKKMEEVFKLIKNDPKING
jgi:PTH1 family peptidyl-tRNA hydrolase